MALVALSLSAYLLCLALGTVPLPLAAPPRSDALLSRGSDLPLIAFLIVLVVGAAQGIRTICRQARASLRLGRRVRELILTSPPVLAEAAGEVGLSGRVVLLDASQPFSFAYGALTPQVALSRGLLESVCADELRAVLQHERYHVVNRDPLKALLAQTISATLFFIPALESLRLRYLAARELSADRSAATMCGRPPLAGALLKVFQGSQWTDLDGVAAIGGPELLDARVAQLETGTEPKLPEISLIRGALSLLGAALFAALFLASASVLGAVFSATELLDAFLCAAPLSGLGIAAYWFIARRAGRRLCVGEPD